MPPIEPLHPQSATVKPPEQENLSPQKTQYTEHWEQEAMQRLYKKFAALIGPLDQPLIEELTRIAQERFKDRSVISMLEIGAGSGRSLAHIAHGLGEKQITYTGIDVSTEQRALFKEKEGGLPATVHVDDYAISSWQEYTPTQKYDLVLAQHSWYGIGADSKYVYKLINSLNEGGIAFVMLSGEDTISLVAWKAMGEKGFSAEDFEKSLSDSGVSFDTIEEESDTYTRESFYKDGRLTQAGIDLCGYLYKKELHGDEPDVITMIESAPENAFRYPKFLFVIKK
jgi:SAM-dependent methyltransferase